MGFFQTNDLRTVHRGTKLSCRFTVQELQQRWYALLYDPAVSRVAVAAMRNLHPELIASVQSRALYSKAEEQLLGTIKSVSVLLKAYQMCRINCMVVCLVCLFMKCIAIPLQLLQNLVVGLYCEPHEFS